MNKFIIDAKMLYNCLAEMPNDEQRGIYAMTAAIHIVEGILPPWCTNIPKPRSKAAVGAYTDEYEAFWKLYPAAKRIDKGGAFTAWKTITKTMQAGLLYKLCAQALAWQSIQENWLKDQGKYIPMPSTYLNHRRWEDEPVYIAKKETYLDMNGIVRTK
jgi:hypothetical protein